MTVQLVQVDDATFHFPHPFWGLTLRLGQSFGWAPGGAVTADGAGRTCYCRPLGQQVSAADASALAAALERALPDMPDEDVEVVAEPGATVCSVPIFNVFSGRNKKVMMRFVAFCRRGGFAIR